jgi:selenocysteine lyase/cysteine desulfurase
MPLDVAVLDPDFVVFPTYKWLLGPYGRAFVYIAKRRQNGEPLEQTGYGRRSIRAEQAPYFADVGYVDGASRFDMGERDHFISLEMASTGMEMMAQWGAASIAPRLAALTQRIAGGLGDLPVRIPDRRSRAPHILSLSLPEGSPNLLVQQLAARGVHVASRVGRVRISPHVYNDEEDVDLLLAALRDLLPRKVA